MTAALMSTWFGQRSAGERAKRGVNDPAVAMLLHAMARLEMGRDEIESAVRSQVGAPHGA
jgi:hypothetical protein